MDFGKASFEELDQHAMELLVFDEGAISPILSGHLFIEAVIEQLLRSRFANPDALLSRNNVSFDLKIDLARAMGALDDAQASTFRALNRIRNRYAHQHRYAVTVEEINALKYRWVDIQNKAFAKAAEKSATEAARLAVIFLCWDAIRLIKEPTT